MASLIGGLIVLGPEPSRAGETCNTEYGKDYINYSGRCIHEHEAARNLAELFPETYEPVKKGELKTKSGLGFHFVRIKLLAEDKALIYCYHQNTGFMTQQQYCKQAGQTGEGRAEE